MTDPITILGLTLALATPILSVIYWVRISPRLFFRVAGEQSGDPIYIKKNARIPFAVGTKSSGHVNILNVAVYFDDNQIDLFKTPGIQKEMSTDRPFLMAIIFPEKKKVKKHTLQSNYFDVQEKVDSFSVKLVAVAEPDHSRLPFWLSILPTRTIRKEKIVHFRVDPNLKEDMKKQGLQLKPKESIQVAGMQSQSGMSAIADKGTATVDVREILND